MAKERTRTLVNKHLKKTNDPHKVIIQRMQQTKSKLSTSIQSVSTPIIA